MSADFTRRLDAILDRVLSEQFLAGEGIGNEIPFHAFDYPPEKEREVQQHIEFLMKAIPQRKPDIRLRHVDLFKLIVGILKGLGYYEKTVEIQKNKGDDAVQSALKGPLSGERIAQAFFDEVKPAQQDLVLISGVGSAYPLVRLHTLLNNLQPLMNQTPLVFFYPGRYDGQSLRLFGKLEDKPYYRAFRLVD